MSNNAPTSPSTRRTHTLQPRTPPSKDQTTSKAKQFQTPTRHVHQDLTNTAITTPLHIYHHNTRSEYNTNNNNNNDDDDTNNDQFAFPNDSPLHFSPSKARAAARQTQQLAVLKRWLSTITTPQPSVSSSSSSASSSSAAVPSPSLSDQTLLLSRWETEHRTLGTTNPDLAAQTTQWLEEVMSMNRLADERRRLIFEAQREELGRLTSTTTSSTTATNEHVDHQMKSRPEATAHDLITDIYSSLSGQGQGVVDSIAESAVLLGHVPAVEGTGAMKMELGQAVLSTTLRAQDLAGYIEELQSLLDMLRKQVREAEDQLAAEKKEEEDAAARADSMHPQTAQWMNEKKQIAIKIREYQDRVSALARSRPGSEMFRERGDDFVSMEDVLEVQERVNRRKSTLANLEKRAGAFGGLPPDLEISREEVQRARAELQRLKARREELFSVLAQRQ